jgi:peptidoglycan/LPS O-acetylase OafA/YrhL
MKAQQGVGGRIPELDGLRGIAIGLVLVSHLLAGTWPADRVLVLFGHTVPAGGGGLIGVQLFFVLSGYLITSILLNEKLRTNEISLRAFYIRRVRRLYPALTVLCIFYGLYVFFTFPGIHRVLEAGASAFLSLTYTMNLADHFHIPSDGWLSHTWSLAVEEQFYLLWPPLLAVLLSRSRRTALIAACTIAIATVLVRYLVQMDFYTAYHLLRWDALLLGCAIALIGIRRLSVKGLGLIGAAVIALYALHYPAQSGAIPNDYLFMTVGCGCALVAAHRSSWLRNRFLTHLGLISYSLYLWHVLILRWGPPAWLGMIVSFAAAEASYRYVERPFLSRREVHMEPAI